MKSTRMVHLECARGIASIIVIFHHFTLAFYPALDKETIGHFGLKWTPLYALINGGGAVTFFFVLSGFVLTLGLFKRPSLEVLTASILKRLPRLMIPIGASIFLGLIVLEFSGSQYHVASIYSGSKWLSDFGDAEFPQNFSPSWRDAAFQSLFVFLFPHRFYYNSSLWTMRDEFYGSLLVFCIVLMFRFERFRGSVVMIVLHIGLAAIFAVYHPAFVSFVAGSFLAYWITNQNTDFQMPSQLTWVLLAGAMILLAVDSWAPNTLAAIFIMLVLLGDKSVALHLSGRMGSLLGTLSFPLYLVHALIILSLSSFVYVQLLSAGQSVLIVFLATFSVTLLTSGVVCIPFVILDTYWVSWLNVRVKSLVRNIFAFYLNITTKESFRRDA